MHFKHHRIALHTPYGRIILRMLESNAPDTVGEIVRLAMEKGCTDCKFYRNEARPSASWGEPPEGPPYALLQGQFGLKDPPPKEGNIAVKYVVFIDRSEAFSTFS